MGRITNIRIAERKDVPAIIDLVRSLATYEKAPQEVTISQEEFEEAGFGDQPVWKAFLAEVDGKVAGFALYYIRFSTWKGCRLYLEDLFVKEEYRGLGLGKLLLNQIITEAKDKKLGGIIWQVLEWNKPAIAFYEKYHPKFDAEWINVSLELKG